MHTDAWVAERAAAGCSADNEDLIGSHIPDLIVERTREVCQTLIVGGTELGAYHALERHVINLPSACVNLSRNSLVAGATRAARAHGPAAQPTLSTSMAISSASCNKVTHLVPLRALAAPACPWPACASPPGCCS